MTIWSIISSCSSLEVVAIQSSNWSFVDVFGVVSLFLFCFFAGDGVLCCFLLLFAVFVAVVAAVTEAVDGRASIRASTRASAEVVDGLFEVLGAVVAAAAETVDGVVEVFDAVASRLLLNPPVGSPMKEEIAD